MLTDRGPGGPTPIHRAAVLGSPIAHSLSPVLHRAAYAALGLRGWSYDRIAVGGPGEPDLPRFLASLGPEWLGFSVTMPLKEAALDVADGVSGRARELGAANTLIRRDDGWVADNTDAFGVLEALQHAGVHRPRRAAILGSGATARSVVDALARLGIRDLVFAVRDRPRGTTVDLAGRLGMGCETTGLDEAGLPALAASVDVLVSTLPTGTSPAPPTPPGSLSGCVVLDVVYGDWPTPLAAWAEAAGATVVSGLEMLLHQAAEQVELMTGRPAPVSAMRAALSAAVDGRGIDPA